MDQRTEINSCSLFSIETVKDTSPFSWFHVSHSEIGRQLGVDDARALVVVVCDKLFLESIDVEGVAEIVGHFAFTV